MRAFDIIGALFLASWFGAIGYVAVDAYSAEEVQRISEDIVLNEGESWMILRSGTTEIGYVHETRNPVEDGWLVEYSMMMNVNLAGMQRSFSSDIRGRIDFDGNLQEVVADVDGGGKKFKIKAVVEESSILITSDLGIAKEQRIPFKERPKLATNVYRRLAALKDPQPGDVIEGNYFDPLTLGNKKMTFEFIEQTEVQNNESVVMTRKFVQRVNDQELDVFVDLEGNVQIQEFPFRIVGNFVPAAFGASRAKALRKSRTKEEGVEFDLSTAQEMLNGKVDETPHTYTVTLNENLVDESGKPTIDLQGFRQSFSTLDPTSRTFLIDTKAPNELDPPTASELESMSVETAKIDFKNSVFDWVDPLAALEKSVAARARGIASKVSDQMQSGSQVAVDTASGAYASKFGDCTEHSLVVVAALRRAKIPARFVYGVKYVDSKTVPHQWVEFWDGRQYHELDATNAELKVPGNVIRLLVDIDPEADRWLTVLQDLKVAPRDENAPEPADFN